MSCSNNSPGLGELYFLFFAFKSLNRGIFKLKTLQWCIDDPFEKDKRGRSNDMKIITRKSWKTLRLEGFFKKKSMSLTL